MFGEENEGRLFEALGESQRLGFLGGRPIDEVVEHARWFVAALNEVTGTVVDLGAGGGTPGLVVAMDRPDLRVTLVDRRTKRTDFLARMVRRLQLSDRVSVLALDVQDALRLGHDNFDAAIARGFGPPELTLSYASSIVRPGGTIVISEPPAVPGGVDRWDPSLLQSAGVSRRDVGKHVACFVKYEGRRGMSRG